MSSSFWLSGKPDGATGIGATELRSQRVARVLCEQIAHHNLQPGAKLPSEKALASHFGVSRPVVREAIAMLKADGIVETFQGSGAFVRKLEARPPDGLDVLTRASVNSLLDLIAVRQVIEGEIAARAAAERSADQLAAIDEALARLRRVQAAGESGVAEDRAFHQAVANACGNAYWRKIVDALAPSMEIAIGVTRLNEALRRDFGVEVEQEHAALRDAIAAGDSEAARAAAQRHMEHSAKRILSADEEFWASGGARVAALRG
jgi:GntR family transcriptional regulator, transcriptional repressor for pyruvate dehydrogenase complex